MAFKPILQNKSMTRGIIPPKVPFVRDYTGHHQEGRGAIFEDTPTINDPSPARVRKDQTILSVEMQRKLRKRFGPNWRQYIGQIADSTITPDEKKPQDARPKAEMVILHGGEIVLSSSESQILEELLDHGRI